MNVLHGLFLLCAMIPAACKRTGITIPPAESTFLNQSSGTYFITGPTVIDTIPVGVTAVAATDRIISFSVSSPTGAVAGTQYTLAADQVTIPAGQAIGYIVVMGNYGYYNGTTRKDTLLFTLTGAVTGGIKASDFNDSFTLAMRGPCVEGEDFDPAEFNGIYNNCVDDLGGSLSATYPVQISSTSTGPTSATLLIQNLGYGFFAPSATDPADNPGITVNIDWSGSPPNLTATLPGQAYESTGYGPATLSGDPGGTFSSCHQLFTLNYDVLIAGIGFDSGPITTTIAR
jgi:hypothetical protein